MNVLRNLLEERYNREILSVSFYNNSDFTKCGGRPLFINSDSSLFVNELYCIQEVTILSCYFEFHFAGLASKDLL